MFNAWFARGTAGRRRSLWLGAHRPVLEALEDRRLLSGLPALFDAPWRSYATGIYPQLGAVALAAGDLDGDGDADAVVGRNFTGGFSNPTPGVSVLLNQGGGNYSPPVHYDLPAPPAQPVGEVALADLDGNGSLDVVATVPGEFGRGNKLALWRNLGDGRLTSHAEFTTGTGPVGLALADFTGDGFLDAATANYGRGFGEGTTVSLLAHNGQKGAAAGFLPAVTITVGPNPRRLAAGDVNGDGRADLVVGRGPAVGDGPSTLTVLRGDGVGGFGAPVNYPAVPGGSGHGTSVALADLDNDGDLDLLGAGSILVGEWGHASILVRRNAGDGTFGPAEPYLSATPASLPQDLRLGDLNGDGFRDVVVASPSGRSPFDGWLVFLGDGAGRLLPGTRYEAGQEVVAAAPVDADRDGDADVLTLSHYSNLLTVHTNPGGGVFTSPVRYRVGSVTDGYDDAADLDRDGDLDLATSDSDVRVLRNNGDGTFAAAQVFDTRRNYAGLKLRDLNGDGYADLLLAPDRNSPPYHFATALNRGDGTFAPETVWFVDACGAGTVDAFDLDHDGDRDVVLTEEGGCFGGGGPRILLFRNDGSGGFSLGSVLSPTYGPMGIAGGDLNGDGHLDLVTSQGVGTGVFLGNGDLTFRPILITGTRPLAFTLADVNRDGVLDIAMIPWTGSPFGTDLIGVSLGRGDGTFAAAVTVPGSSTLLSGSGMSSDVDVADVDGDGRPDLVVSNVGSNDVSVFLGNGDGTVRLYQRYGVGHRAGTSIVADFTRDGLLDLATLVSEPPSGLTAAVVVLRGLPNSEAVADTARWGGRGPGVDPLSLLSAPLPTPAPATANAPTPRATLLPPDSQDVAEQATPARVGARQLLESLPYRGTSDGRDKDWLNLALWQL